MKISSVSKKVLASALSAAMVVAFAPTVAFGKVATADKGDKVTVKVSYELTNQATGQKTEAPAVEFYTLGKAAAAANAAVDQYYYNGSLYTKAAGGNYAEVGTDKTKVYTKVTGTKIELVEDASNTGATGAEILNEAKVNLAGKTLTLVADDSTADETVTIEGTGTIAEGSTVENLVIAKGADVTIEAGVTIAGDLTVKGSATIAPKTGAANVDLSASNIVVDHGGSLTFDAGKFDVSKIKVAKAIDADPENDVEAKAAGSLAINAAEIVDDAVAGTESSLADWATVIKDTETTPGDRFTAASCVASDAAVSFATDLVTVGQVVATKTVSGVTTSYMTVAAALADANATDVIKLTEKAAKDTTAVASVKIAGATLDLNGQTLTGLNFNEATKLLKITGTGSLVNCDVKGPLSIEKGANVTFAGKDKTTGGKVTTDYGEVDGAINVYGTLTVEGTDSNSSTNITVENGGTLTTAKGKFGNLGIELGGKATVNGGDFGTITPVTVGETSTKKAVLSIAKGTYTGTELAAKYVASGSVMNKTAAAAFEVGAPVATAEIVDQSNNGEATFAETKKFASVSGAIYNASLSKGQTKVVSLDVDVVENVTSADGVTIDLNGHKITGADDATATITVSAGDTLTIKGSGTVDAVKAGKNVTSIETGSTLNVKGGTFLRSAEGATNTGVIFAKAVAATGTTVNISGGDFTAVKSASKLSDVATLNVKGGTFAYKVTPAANYIAAQNAAGAYEVLLGINVTFPAETSFYGGDVVVADKDDALEKAATKALSAVYAAAQSANPAATTLDGFVFKKDKAVKDLTAAGTLAVALQANMVIDPEKVTLAKDKDYTLGTVYTVDVAVLKGGQEIGYLTGLDMDVTLKSIQSKDNTYKLLGAEGTYNADDSVYTFKTKSNTQFAVERISNTIKDIVDNQEQAAEKATQSIDVAQKSKTVKLAKGKTKTQKAVSFAMGASAETGLTIAKKSGSSRITVKGQKVTLKKGTKKGTFTAKVSIKAAASDEYLAAAKTITVKFVVKK